MPASHVLVCHDDGRWYRAALLGQFRVEGRWRAVVRYTVAPGMTYQRGLWADELRRADAAEYDKHTPTDPGGGGDQPVGWVIGRRGD